MTKERLIAAHLRDALHVARTNGDRFLAYLIEMAAQEARDLRRRRARTRARLRHDKGSASA